DPEASAEARKAQFAAMDDDEALAKARKELEDDPNVLMQRESESDAEFAVREAEWHRKIDEHNNGGPEGVAALEAVARIPKENLANFFNALENRYPDEDDELSSEATFTLYRGESDENIIRTLVEAIGADRTRALGKNISALIFNAVGRAALPNCEWCKGSGLSEGEFNGQKFNVPCECTRRHRGEDFGALQARLR